MAATLLFSIDLISPEVQKALPEGYKLRPLLRNDFQNGHLAVLNDLAFLGDITEQKWVERFDFMKNCSGTYYVVVIEDSSRKPGNTLVATATLMVEKKLSVNLHTARFADEALTLHPCSLFKLGTQGHIEDVAVIGDQQGKKLGVRLLAALDFIADKVGCYKVSFDLPITATLFGQSLLFKFRPFLTAHLRMRASTSNVIMRRLVLRCIAISMRRQRRRACEARHAVLK
jgi:glucosamine-phosphate N-acetyltransferase